MQSVLGGDAPNWQQRSDRLVAAALVRPVMHRAVARPEPVALSGNIALLWWK